MTDKPVRHRNYSSKHHQSVEHDPAEVAVVREELWMSLRGKGEEKGGGGRTKEGGGGEGKGRGEEKGRGGGGGGGGDRKSEEKN